MTMHRTKYCDRVERFKAQMEPSQEYHAIQSSNFGDYNYVAYKVTAKNGLEFYVRLYETITKIKSKISENGKEVDIDVHPDKVIEGLDKVQQFFLDLLPLQGSLEKNT